jgi:hypothetical protein
MADASRSPDSAAFEALRRAYASGRIIIVIDVMLLNRPGSPVFSVVDVFAPPLALLASSLTLLFAFGVLPWIAALIVILLYQVYAAHYLVYWRLRQRAVSAMLRNSHNLQILWAVGGCAIALKDLPERNCIAPHGDWRAFARDLLMDRDASTTAIADA